jgi:hypothetical protein
MLRRSSILALDASFDHAFGTEYRTEYEFYSARAHTVTLDLVVTDRPEWREWMTQLPAYVAWTWDDESGEYDAPFNKVTITSNAYLQSFSVELVGQSVLVSIVYSYENEIDSLDT